MPKPGIPGIDAEIGMSHYATEFPGTGGRIRAHAEDFAVSEVISGMVLRSISEENGYAIYRLKKRNIDTAHAISEAQAGTGIRLKALGLKDASAMTEQFVCARNRGPSARGFNAGRFSLERLGYAKRPLTKKDMTGNHFKIRIRNAAADPGGFAEHGRVLNYYGYQRFGSRRPVTHHVGRAMLRRDFGGAVRLILSYTSIHDTKQHTELRQKLSDGENYARYLGQVPPGMDVERIIMEQMIQHGDPQRAMRSIPVSLRRLYVQAYQSYLFNRTLSDAFSGSEDLFACQDGDVGFDQKGIIGRHAPNPGTLLAVPTVGYSYYKKTRFHPYISKIMESEDIMPRDFIIKEMQEASSEGGFRQAAIRCTGYACESDTVQFTLSRGSFATVLLREIIKPRDPLLAGF